MWKSVQHSWKLKHTEAIAHIKANNKYIRRASSKLG
jgi:hypothetical protein